LKEVLEPKADSAGKEAMKDGTPSAAEKDSVANKDSAAKAKPGIAMISSVSSARRGNPGPTGSEA
jgi:hypothetical protein